MDGVICINKNIKTDAEKFCICKEEQGHLILSQGNITDQGVVNNRKQEKKARTWAYLNTISTVNIDVAYKSGASNLCEVAEYLGVTEEFLKGSIQALEEVNRTCAIMM